MLRLLIPASRFFDRGRNNTRRHEAVKSRCRILFKFLSVRLAQANPSISHLVHRVKGGGSGGSENLIPSRVLLGLMLDILPFPFVDGISRGKSGQPREEDSKKNVRLIVSVASL
ncbi:hypothetical protein L1887_36275 [Cichorium endivia]|nr:hypothetical protein L1887_36275 [Cichorium endivia]